MSTSQSIDSAVPDPAAQTPAAQTPVAQPPLPDTPNASMQEFYQLQRELLLITVGLTGIIFVCVWFFYTLNIALNYLLGACTCVVYLKVLARNVEQLGRQKAQIGKSHIALFVGLIIVATQLNQLYVVPVFLGFLTYKGTLLIYMFRSLMPTNSNSSRVG